MSDNEYWLVAVPGEQQGPDVAWTILSEKLRAYSACFKFPIPELKVLIITNNNHTITFKCIQELCLIIVMI